VNGTKIQLLWTALTLGLSSCNGPLSDHGTPQWDSDPQWSAKTNCLIGSKRCPESMRKVAPPAPILSPKPVVQVSPSPQPSLAPVMSDVSLSTLHAATGSSTAEELGVVFTQEMTIPFESGTVQARRQKGEWVAEANNKANEFSCVVTTQGDAQGATQLKIPQGASYLFHSTDFEDNGGIQRITLVHDFGGDSDGDIQQLECFGGGGSFMLSDFLEAFGSANIEAKIQSYQPSAL
jgi:hypothetical protein